MLKCVLLAKWFGLSDPQLEECLAAASRARRRNALDFALNLIAYNWKRSLSLTREG